MWPRQREEKGRAGGGFREEERDQEKYANVIIYKYVGCTGLSHMANIKPFNTITKSGFKRRFETLDLNLTFEHQF